jgi:hypothetical protein
MNGMKRNFYLSVKGKLRVIGSLHQKSLSTLYTTFILRTVKFFLDLRSSQLLPRWQMAAETDNLCRA